MKFMRITIETCEIPNGKRPTSRNGMKFGTLAILPPVKTMKQFWKIDTVVRKAIEPFRASNRKV